MPNKTLFVYTDGGSRGNPGPGAIGILILTENKKVLFSHAACVGSSTNNQAEYRALIAALEHARAFSPREIVCHSDSQLLINQMSGKYRVHNPLLRELHGTALRLARTFTHVSYRQLPRTHPRIAQVDALLNAALDAAGH